MRNALGCLLPTQLSVLRIQLSGYSSQCLIIHDEQVRVLNAVYSEGIELYSMNSEENFVALLKHWEIVQGCLCTGLTSDRTLPHWLR